MLNRDQVTISRNPTQASPLNRNLGRDVGRGDPPGVARVGAVHGGRRLHADHVRRGHHGE